MATINRAFKVDKHTLALECCKLWGVFWGDTLWRFGPTEVEVEVFREVEHTNPKRKPIYTITIDLVDLTKLLMPMVAWHKSFKHARLINLKPHRNGVSGTLQWDEQYP